MVNQQTNVTTGQVRLSYAHLFKPYANKQGQDPKYSVTILLPKSDIATKQRIDAAINVAIQAGVASKWNGIRPPQIAVPIHDGDGGRPSDGMPFGEECKGHWVFTASSNQPPAIVDINLNPIINQTEIYSGIYARVNINFFPYFNSGKKGIGCGLGPVQKFADGEPLGGQITAEAAFGGDASGYQPTQNYPQQQPAQPAYPQQGYGQSTQPPVQPGSGYPQQGYAPPAQPIQQPIYPQPGYAPVTQPAQQPAQSQQPVQYDPITGAPITGGIFGI